MNKEQEILERNLLIAEFIGCRIVSNDYGIKFIGHIDMFDASEHGFNCTEEELKKSFNSGNLDAWFIHQDNIKYHSDWNDLMGVVEKIYYEDFATTLQWSKIVQAFQRPNIETVYNAVVDFIQWYNKNNSQNT